MEHERLSNTATLTADLASPAVTIEERLREIISRLDRLAHQTTLTTESLFGCEPSCESENKEDPKPRGFYDRLNKEITDISQLLATSENNIERINESFS